MQRRTRGCGTRLSCNFQGQSKFINHYIAIYCNCTKCKKDGMVNVITTNLKLKSKPLYCAKCKRDDMVNIKHLECKGARGCGTRPHFNFEYINVKGPTRDDMVINIVSIKCKGGCGINTRPS
eukprot:Pgem_evm1s2118